MTQTSDVQDLMKSVADKSQKILASMQATPNETPLIVRQYMDLTEDYQTLLKVIVQHPQEVFNAQMQYFQDSVQLWQDQMEHWMQGKTLPIKDRRFRHDEWIWTLDKS